MCTTLKHQNVVVAVPSHSPTNHQGFNLCRGARSCCAGVSDVVAAPGLPTRPAAPRRASSHLKPTPRREMCPTWMLPNASSHSALRVCVSNSLESYGIKDCRFVAFREGSMQRWQLWTRLHTEQMTSSLSSCGCEITDKQERSTFPSFCAFAVKKTKNLRLAQTLSFLVPNKKVAQSNRSASSRRAALVQNVRSNCFASHMARIASCGT